VYEKSKAIFTVMGQGPGAGVKYFHFPDSTTTSWNQTHYYVLLKLRFRSMDAGISPDGPFAMLRFKGQQTAPGFACFRRCFNPLQSHPFFLESALGGSPLTLVPAISKQPLLARYHS